jgi:hypothetical protein
MASARKFGKHPKKYLKQQLKKPTVIPVKSSGKKCLQEGRLLI